MMERITALKQPPVVGQFYLVPTVLYNWLGRTQDWPVFLPRHDDAAHLNFAHQHYHVDPRFVSPSEWQFAGHERNYFARVKPTDSDAYASFQGYPLNRLDGNGEPVPHPPVVWRKMRCQRTAIPYQHSHQIAPKLSPAYVGRQCKRGRTGWVCPHKAVPLGSFVPVDGVVTCPLHGLQIDVETGKVVGPVVECAA